MMIQIPIQGYDFHHFFPGKQMLWFNSKMVGELIASMKLVPAQVNVIRGGVAAGGVEQMAVGHAAIGAVAYNGTHGGIRALHLHFNDQIYLLTEKQWGEISQKILANVKAKLNNVKEISFEEGVILASMFEG
jgi:hypothetical protein